VNDELLVEIVTDLQVEIQTIHKCLEQLEALPELVKEKRREVEQNRASIRSDVEKRLADLQSGGQEPL
jgi:hypothetical protein